MKDIRFSNVQTRFKTSVFIYRAVYIAGCLLIAFENVGKAYIQYIRREREREREGAIERERERERL